MVREAKVDTDSQNEDVTKFEEDDDPESHARSLPEEAVAETSKLEIKRDDETVLEGTLLDTHTDPEEN